MKDIKQNSLCIVYNGLFCRVPLLIRQTKEPSGVESAEKYKSRVIGHLDASLVKFINNISALDKFHVFVSALTLKVPFFNL